MAETGMRMFMFLGSYEFGVIGCFLSVIGREKTQDPGLEDARTEGEAHEHGPQVLLLRLVSCGLVSPGRFTVRPV